MTTLALPHKHIRSLRDSAQNWTWLKNYLENLNIAAIETGYFNVRDYGAKGDYNSTTGLGTDDSSAFQDAIDAALDAGRGVVWVPYGKYRLEGEFEFPENVTIKGTDPIASQVFWTAMDNNTFGFKFTATDETNQSRDRFRGMHGLALNGPGKSTANKYRGIRWLSRVDVQNCWFQNWWAPLYVWGNHQTVSFSHISNNHYAVFYPAGTPSSGDQTYVNAGMTLCDKASIGIETDGTMLTSAFIDCHFGEAPHGIYAEGLGTAGVAMTDCDFYSCNFEDYGNTVFELGVDNWMLRTRMYATKFRRNLGRTNGDYLSTAIRCGAAIGCKFDDCYYDVAGGSGSRNPNGFISASVCRDVTFHDIPDMIASWVDALDWPLIAQTFGVLRNCGVQNTDAEYQYYRNNEAGAMARHRAVSFIDTADPGDTAGNRDILKLRYAHSTNFPRVLGVSLHGAATGGAVLVQTKGLRKCECLGPAGSIVNGDKLRASATAGLLEKATGDSPSLMGWAYDDNFGAAPVVVPTFINPTQLDLASQTSTKVTHSVAQAIATGGAIITWDTDVYDTPNMHDPAVNPTRITVTRDGEYMINAYLLWATNGAGIRRLDIRKNGSATPIGGIAVPSVAGMNARATATAKDKAVAGDYYEIFGYQDTGANLNLNTTSYFAVHRIGDG